MQPNNVRNASRWQHSLWRPGVAEHSRRLSKLLVSSWVIAGNNVVRCKSRTLRFISLACRWFRPVKASAEAAQTALLGNEKSVLIDKEHQPAQRSQLSGVLRDALTLPAFYNMLCLKHFCWPTLKQPVCGQPVGHFCVLEDDYSSAACNLSGL